jgi:hypothetical protein
MWPPGGGWESLFPDSSAQVYYAAVSAVSTGRRPAKAIPTSAKNSSRASSRGLSSNQFRN